MEGVTVFSTDSSSTHSVKHFRKKRAGAFISNDTCLFVAKPSLSPDYVTTATWLVESHNGPYSPPTYRCRTTIHPYTCFPPPIVYSWDQKKWIEIWFLNTLKLLGIWNFGKSRDTGTEEDSEAFYKKFWSNLSIIKIIQYTRYTFYLIFIQFNIFHTSIFSFV